MSEQQQPTIAELWKKLSQLIQGGRIVNQEGYEDGWTGKENKARDEKITTLRAELLERCKPWICVQKNGNICVDVRFVPTNPDSETLRKCIAIYEFAAYLIDQKEKGVVMDDPTSLPIIHDDSRPLTVGGWMRTLPPLENAPNWGLNYGVENQLCKSLDSALCVLLENTSNFIRGYGYYLGVLDFLRGKVMDEARSNHYRDGYFAAKAAFEAQQQPEPTYSVTVSQGMASMPWADFSELTEKAALCDTLKAENARLKVKADAFDTSLTGDLLELQRKAAAYDLMDAQQAILMQAIAKWGEESQMGMAIEECGEMLVETNAALSRFIVACRKVSRVGGREVKPEAKEKLIDETADVFVVMRQMAIMLGRDAVNERIAFKIDRLKGRLEK